MHRRICKSYQSRGVHLLLLRRRHATARRRAERRPRHTAGACRRRYLTNRARGTVRGASPAARTSGRRGRQRCPGASRRALPELEERAEALRLGSADGVARECHVPYRVAAASPPCHRGANGGANAAVSGHRQSSLASPNSLKAQRPALACAGRAGLRIESSTTEPRWRGLLT